MFLLQWKCPSLLAYYSRCSCKIKSRRIVHKVPYLVPKWPFIPPPPPFFGEFFPKSLHWPQKWRARDVSSRLERSIDDRDAVAEQTTRHQIRPKFGAKRSALPAYLGKSLIFRFSKKKNASVGSLIMFIRKGKIFLSPGATPTIVSYNASAGKIYNATSTLVRFENKNSFFFFEKTL
jgi:hypothetical protein